MVYAVATGALNAQNDPRAEKILAAAKNKVNSLNDLSAGFNKIFEMRDGNVKPTTISGKLKMKKDKFRIDLKEQLLICDGKTMWTVLRNDREVTVSRYDPKDGISPASMFNFTQKNMKARYDGVDNVFNVPADKVTMFPLHENHEFFKVELWVEQKTTIPRKMKVWNRSGSIITFDVTDLATNTNVNPAEFTFQESDCMGCEKIDNR
ncbi:MAG: outer membrane lipoprotein carrier protein LolA [Bacteroidia bacterium]|nr:outer membrane lipoprotein carrier protein LolA [Bacteroidia bacterium]